MRCQLQKGLCSQQSLEWKEGEGEGGKGGQWNWTDNFAIQFSTLANNSTGRHVGWVELLLQEGLLLTTALAFQRAVSTPWSAHFCHPTSISLWESLAWIPQKRIKRGRRGSVYSRILFLNHERERIAVLMWKTSAEKQSVLGAPPHRLSETADRYTIVNLHVCNRMPYPTFSWTRRSAILRQVSRQI